MVIASPPAAIVSSNGYINSSQDFEKWMRMATDNKINTSNSWDLALIDYFYDLSLLRDGDGINFQRASATLDGCVKIYSSRIDSAVTETGRLINGLAASRTTGAQIDDDDDDDPEIGKNSDIDSETGTKRKRKNLKTQNSTLVDFEAIKVKKMDIELYVDPIFKKVLTDFDEGGSKSLLLNMLHTNQDQRIEFDTTDTGVPTLLIKEENDSISDIENSFAGMDIDDPQEPQDTATIDNEHPGFIDEAVMSLGQKYFGNEELVSSTICPSLSDLDSIVNHNTSSADLIKNLENVEINQGFSPNPDFSYGGDGGGDEFDIGFSNEIAHNEPKYPGNKSSIFFDDLEEDSNDYGMTMRMLFNEDKTFEHKDSNILDHDSSTQILNIPDENLLAYFDENQRNQWAGPDHWKILKLKKLFGTLNTSPSEDSVDNTITKPKPRKRLQREQFRIDFLSDDFPDEELLFTASKTTTLLPRAQWISKSKNVLPEDKHYSTKNFINLFLKEKLINSIFNKVENVDQPINESLYASNCSLVKDSVAENDRPFDADFFHNYDGDADNFEVDSQQQSLDSQLKIKSHSSQSPLNFERVAKKIDIKLLKDNIWDSLKKEKATRESLTSLPSKIEETAKSLKFSEVVHGLNTRYEGEEKKELSTSFCFICLLHLANENGFSISNTKDHNDLVIQGL